MIKLIKKKHFYYREFKNVLVGKNIEDTNIRYKDYTYDFDDEILNKEKNKKIGKIRF